MKGRVCRDAPSVALRPEAEIWCMYPVMFALCECHLTGCSPWGLQVADVQVTLQISSDHSAGKLMGTFSSDQQWPTSNASFLHPIHRKGAPGDAVTPEHAPFSKAPRPFLRRLKWLATWLPWCRFSFTAMLFSRFPC